MPGTACRRVPGGQVGIKLTLATSRFLIYDGSESRERSVRPGVKTVVVGEELHVVARRGVLTTKSREALTQHEVAPPRLSGFDASGNTGTSFGG